MKTKIRLLGIAVFALASLPMLASITEDLVLSDGLGNSITVDQAGNVTKVGTGTISSATGSGGDITFLGTIGNFTFDLDSGQAVPGTTMPTLMTTTTVNVLSTGSGTLTVTFSQIGYPVLSSLLSETANDGYSTGLRGSTVSFKGYDSASNTINATTNPIGTVLSTTDSSNALQSDAATANYANTVASGSLTEVIALGFTGAGSVNTGFTIANVATPEPAGIVLLGSFLLALAGLFRKRLARRA